MKGFGGNGRSAVVVGLCALLNNGCINHDQVYLANPSPCHISCEYDHVKRLDPECSGYHTTCWRPWSAFCPNCPPPEAGVGVDLPPAEQFQISPGEALPVSPPATVMPEPIPSPTPAPPSLSNPSGQTSDFRSSAPQTPAGRPDYPRPTRVQSATADPPFGGRVIPTVFELAEPSASTSPVPSQGPPRQGPAANSTPDPALISAVLSMFSTGQQAAAADDHPSPSR